jgi:hypothetical protein
VECALAYDFGGIEEKGDKADGGGLMPNSV